MFDEMDEVAQDYDQRIRSARESAGLSQEELAQEVGLSRNYLSQIERGRATNLSFEVVRRISERLGLPVHEGAGPGSVPESLRRFADEAGLPPADVAMLASGTATLEGLLLKKPMVVGYRVGRFTYAVLSRLVKTPWVAMANWLVEEELAPELIQDDFTPEALVREVGRWLDHPEAAARLAQRYEAVHHNLKRDADARAAEAIHGLLTDKT